MLWLLNRSPKIS